MSKELDFQNKRIFTFALSCVRNQKMFYNALLGPALWIKKKKTTYCQHLTTTFTKSFPHIV